MKKKSLLVVIGIFIGIGIGVGASTLFNSNQVLYKNDKTVEEALNDLYTKSSIGNATASDILSGKKALVGGQEVTGNLSFTSLSGTANVGAGSYSTLLNGYYNLSNYRIKCGTNSCSACNSCCTSSGKKGSLTCSTQTNCTINTGLSSISQIIIYTKYGTGYSSAFYIPSITSQYIAGYNTGDATAGCRKNVGASGGMNYISIMSVSGGNVTFQMGSNRRTSDDVYYWVAF